MLPLDPLFVIAIALFAYAAVARRLERTSLTGPTLFLALGFGLQAVQLAGETRPELRQWLDVTAEVTLALVLFADAARTDARMLVRVHAWPLRALAIGLPLAIIGGAAAASALLPHWPVWEAAILAAVLAPTDAALGEAVVSNEDLPMRVRRTITVESGLNDGLALPAVVLFALLASREEAEATGRAVEGVTQFLGFLGAQIGFGAAAGIGAGFAAGWLLRRARRAGFSSDRTEGVAAIATMATAFFGAEILGGNAFVACFSGGLAFGLALRGPDPAGLEAEKGGFLAEFLDNEGMLLILLAFLLIGADLLPLALEHVGWRELAFIGLSLFVIRPAAIWISLMGTDASPRMRLFLGWFGPRGLATALFALLAIDRGGLSMGDELLGAAAAAVAISAVLHGATAAPFSRRFGASLIPPGGERD